MSYAAWKLLHVAAVILFLGNITTGVSGRRAHRSRDWRLITSTFEGITRSDRWFTIPGVIGIVVGGVAAAMKGNLPILGTGWILWPIVLLSFSGILFGARVGRSSNGSPRSLAPGIPPLRHWEAYGALYRRWELWGLLALIAPVVAMGIMVLKPSLPGF